MRLLFMTVEIFLVALTYAPLVASQEVELHLGTETRELPNGSRIQETMIRIESFGLTYVSDSGTELAISLGQSSVVAPGRIPISLAGRGESLPLELVSDQIDQLNKIKEQFFDGLKKFVAQLMLQENGELNDEHALDIQRFARRLQIKKEKEAFDVLLPFQVNSLKKQHAQRLFRNSPSRFLKLPSVKEAFDVSAEELNGVHEIERTVNEEIKATSKLGDLFLFTPS